MQILEVDMTVPCWKYLKKGNKNLLKEREHIVCVCVCVYTRIYTYVYIYMYMHTHAAHAHTHPDIPEVFSC